MILSVIDFDTPQHAFDAAGDGDRIYFPGVRRYDAPSSGWIVRNSIEIFGDGPGGGGASATLISPSATGDVFVLDPPDPPLPPDLSALQAVCIRDLRIEPNAPTGTAGQDGVRLVQKDRTVLGGIRLERLAINRMGRHGVNLQGSTAPAVSQDVIGPLMVDCDIGGCGQTGMGSRRSPVALPSTRAASGGTPDSRHGPGAPTATRAT